jgi:hypothetical protein
MALKGIDEKAIFGDEKIFEILLGMTNFYSNNRK